MAHGWNSFVQSISSDTSTLRVPLDTEENLAQHLESLIEHNALSNLVDTQEEPSPEASLNSNFYLDSNTNSDFVQQKYYNEPWPEGQQAVQGQLPKYRDSTLSDFATGEITSGNVPSSLGGELGLRDGKQDCDTLNPSFLEEYSDVSSSSMSDVDNIKHFCEVLHNESHQLSETQETGNASNVSLKESACTGESSEWAKRLSALECEQREHLHGAQERIDREVEACIQGDQPSSASHSPRNLESAKQDDLCGKKKEDYQDEKEDLGDAQERLDGEEVACIQGDQPSSPSRSPRSLASEKQDYLDEKKPKEDDQDEREQEVKDRKESHMKNELPDTLSAASGCPCASESGREEDIDDASRDWKQEESGCVVERKETYVQADQTPSVAIKNLSAPESEMGADVLNNAQERRQHLEEKCEEKTMQAEHLSSKSVSQSEVDDDEQEREKAEDQIRVKRDDLHLMPCSARESLTTSVSEAKVDSKGNEPMEQKVACSKQDDPYSDVRVQADQTPSVAIKDLSAPESEMDADVLDNTQERVLDNTQERGQVEEDCEEKSMQEEHLSDSVSGISAGKSVSQSESEVDNDEQEGKKAEDQIRVKRDDSHLKTCSGQESLPTSVSEVKEDSKGNEPMEQKVACSKQDAPYSDVSFNGHSEDSITRECLEEEYMPSSTQEPVHPQAIKISDAQDSAQKLNDSKKQVCLDVSEQSLGLCNSESQSKPEHDGICPIEETDRSSLLEEDQMDMEAPDLFRAGTENARGTFQEEDLTNDCKEPPLLSVCYGEPLSSEDSLSGTEGNCEAISESCQVESEHMTVDNTEHKNDSKTLVPQLKSSLVMSKCLHPITLLDNLERKNNTEAFHCGECKHSTLNVDHIIKHHHCEHSQYEFQHCQTCDTYLTSNQLAEQHLCGVDPVSSDTSQQRKQLAMPVTFRCRYCSRTFPERSSLNNHIRSHSRTTQLKCNRCGRHFAQRGYLNKHKRLNKCLPSSSKLATQKLVDKNVSSVYKNNAVNPYILPTESPCGNLPDCFVKLEDVSKQIICVRCSKTFTSRLKLSKHKYNVHRHDNKSDTSFTHAEKQEGVSKAGTEKRSIPKARTLRRSIPQARTERRSIPQAENEKRSVPKARNDKYECPLCPRIFKYSYNRIRHMREQCIVNFTSCGKGKAGNKYQCPLCHTNFNHATNRTRHIKMICLKEYSRRTRSRARARRNSEHKDNLQQTERQRLPLMTTTPHQIFKCKLCPAVFAHYSGLYRHSKKHELFKTTGKVVKYRRSIIITKQSKNTVSEDVLPLKEDHSLPFSCHVCGKCFNRAYSLKKHVRKHKSGKPHHSLESEKGIRKEDNLLAHKKVPQRRIQCTVCKKILPTITELIQHRQSHIKKGVLQCPDCPMTFHYPNHLLRHVASHQRKEPKEQAHAKQESTPRNCPICKGVFESAKALRIHCLEHNAVSSRECPFCKRQFTQRQSMLRHLQLHTGEKAYSCPICNKSFFRKLTMQIHENNCPGPEAQPAVIVDKGHQDLPAVIVSKGPQVKPAVNMSEGPHVKLAVNMIKGPQVELAVTVRKEKGPRKFKCTYCPREFERENRLIIHHSNHSSLFPCGKCGSFFGRNKLKSHEDNCNTSILDRCRGCGKRFSRKSNRIVHERTCKSMSSSQNSQNSVGIGIQSKDKTQYKCPHCPTTMRYRSYLLRHLQTHNREQYSCMHCGQRYSSQQRYLQHEAFCDGVKKPLSSSAITETSPMSGFKEPKKQSKADVDGEFKCKFCTKTFMKSRNLRRHILTHNEVKPYRCKTCDSCFSRHDHLKLHQTRCKGKRRRLEVCITKISPDDIGRGWQNNLNLLNKRPLNEFQCSSCSKHFSSKSNLARHFSLRHATLKPFGCTRCGISFTQEKSLRRHRTQTNCRTVSTKTGSLPPSLNSEIVKDLPSRDTNRLLQRNELPSKRKLKYSCTHCPRAFKGHEALRVHIRLHTGERPYGCADCGVSFIRRDYLQRHLSKCKLRGEQLCEKCGGVFSSDKLHAHQSTCTVKPTAPRPTTRVSTPGNPPRGFSCAYCSSRFLLFSQLQQHFINTHREETTLKSPIQTPPPPLHLQSSNAMNIKEEPLDDGFGDAHLSIDNDDVEDVEDVDSDDDDADEMAKPLPCPHCKMRFVNRGGLTRHMQVHTGDYPYKCKRCTKGFWNRTLYRKHVGKCSKHGNMVKEEHSTDTSALNDTVLVFNQGSQTTGTGVLQTNFSCKDELLDATQDDLPRKLRKGSSSDKNKDKSKAVQYQCSECDQSFTDGLMLISHLEDHGREDQMQKLATCQKCGKKCTSPGNLERHMRVHANEKSHSCPECAKTFLSSSELDIHRTCHDPNRPFVCVTCKHRFWTSQSLGKHYSESHPEDSYSCHFCQKSYTHRASLVRHCKMRHQTHLSDEVGGLIKENETTAQGLAIKVNVNEKEDTSDSDETNEDENDSGSDSNDSDSADYFPCHVCGKTFLTSESLEDHQRCHTGEKPHECAECGKCFFQAAQLQQHERSHKSEFQCPTCGRGFVSLFALRKHKHTHGKSRPHRCPKCHLCFTGPSQLAEHLATHRDDNFPCDICDRTFSCKISRAEHRKIHTEQEDAPPSVIPPKETTVPPPSASSSAVEYLTCGVCNEHFKNPQLLSEHKCLAATEKSSEEIHAKSLQSSKHSPDGSNLKIQPSQNEESLTYKYQCAQCHVSFAYPQHFRNHLKRHSDVQAPAEVLGGGIAAKAGETAAAEKMYKCPICPQSFAQALELSAHLSVHTENTFKCNICKLTYPSRSKLAEHERCHMTAATQYECTECGQSFLGSDAFRQHRCSRRQRAGSTQSEPHPSTSKPTATSKPSTSKPTATSKPSTSTPTATSKHSTSTPTATSKHSSSKPTATSKPSTSKPTATSKPSTSTPTATSKHSTSKPTATSKPSSSKPTPTSKSAIEEEELDVGEDFFNCLDCSKRFFLKQDLLEHQKKYHPTELFTCKLCKKTFTRRRYLTDHLRRHKEKAAKAQQEGKDMSKCSHCPKSFDSAQDLQLHMRTHAEQEGGEHRCDMCYKSFSQLSRLRQHQESHVGQVVYECTECDKAFAIPHLLVDHQKTHVVPTII